MSRRRLERTVLAALRERLFTEDNLRPVIDHVRETLRERACRHMAEAHRADRTKERRRVEAEIEHIKEAVRLGKATSTLLEMLEDAERRLAALSASAAHKGDGIPARLARVLDRLPELVRERLDDLEALLATQQVEKGKAILQALDTTVRLHPVGDHLEVEITGRIEGVLALLTATRSEGQKRWLGEEDFCVFDKPGRRRDGRMTKPATCMVSD